MNRLVLVVPLRAGTRERVRELLREGPPFELDATRLVQHDVYLSEHEAVFVFETAGDAPPLEIRAADPALREAASAWREVMAGPPRKAEPAYRWQRER